MDPLTPELREKFLRFHNAYEFAREKLKFEGSLMHPVDNKIVVISTARIGSELAEWYLAQVPRIGMPMEVENMKSLILSFVLVLSPAVCLAQGKVESPEEPSISKAGGRLDEWLGKAAAVAEIALKGQQVPGLSLVVMKGDDLLLARGYGLEDVGRKDAVTPDTVFELGSMTKQ